MNTMVEKIKNNNESDLERLPNESYREFVRRLVLKMKVILEEMKKSNREITNILQR